MVSPFKLDLRPRLRYRSATTKESDFKEYYVEILFKPNSDTLLSY